MPLETFSRKLERFENQSLEVRQIIYDLACFYGFEYYSTVDEIDDKFWDDTPTEDIAIKFAKLLLEARNEKV